jgi:hypothetical protein
MLQPGAEQEAREVAIGEMLNVGCFKRDCGANVIRCVGFYNLIDSDAIGNVAAVLVHLVSRDGGIPENVVEGVNTTHGAILALKVELYRLDRGIVGKGGRWCWRWQWGWRDGAPNHRTAHGARESARSRCGKRVPEEAGEVEGVALIAWRSVGGGGDGVQTDAADESICRIKG